MRTILILSLAFVHAIRAVVNPGLVTTISQKFFDNLKTNLIPYLAEEWKQQAFDDIKGN